MSPNRSSVRLSSQKPAALAGFEMAVARVAAHKPRVCDALHEALSAEPEFPAALAFSGFASVLLARRETLVIARQRHAEAVTAIRGVAPTPAETALVEALGLAVEGRLLKAAARLEEHLVADPHDFLAFKIAHSLRFMGGDEPGMLASSSRLLPQWNIETPFYGYLLGCHAFGLGEANRLVEADAAGRRAIEIAPDDAWGAHAVAHVYETRGMSGDGIAWLEQTRPLWSRCNNFSFHMAWHLALFHLARGEFGLALATYDADVRPIASDDFRDLSNAISLLWRLERRGCHVGERWDELHAIAQRRAEDTTLVFASLHHLLTCLACDDRVGAARIIASLERAGTGAGDQAEIAERIGAPLSRALQIFNARTPAAFDLAGIVGDLPMIGGSNAQRDVFVRTLANIAAARVQAILPEQRVA